MIVVKVTLICDACFSPISQSILNWYLWNCVRIIFDSPAKYCDIFIQKHYVVEKIDLLIVNQDVSL